MLAHTATTNPCPDVSQSPSCSLAPSQATLPPRWPPSQTHSQLLARRGFRPAPPSPWHTRCCAATPHAANGPSLTHLEARAAEPRRPRAAERAGPSRYATRCTLYGSPRFLVSGGHPRRGSSKATPSSLLEGTLVRLLSLAPSSQFHGPTHGVRRCRLCLAAASAAGKHAIENHGEPSSPRRTPQISPSPSATPRPLIAKSPSQPPAPGASPSPQARRVARRQPPRRRPTRRSRPLFRKFVLQFTLPTRYNPFRAASYIAPFQRRGHTVSPHQAGPA